MWVFNGNATSTRSSKIYLEKLMENGGFTDLNKSVELFKLA